MSKSDKTLDPRVRRTRKLLKQAFMELIGEKGFDAMTVQDIADRAEINRATFYAHYTDKFEMHDSLLLEWFQKQLETYHVSVDSSFCGDNLRNLIYAVCDFQARLNSSCHPIDMQYKPAIEDLIQSEIYSIVYQWIGQLEGITHPDIHAASVSWAIFGAGLQWSKSQQHSKDTVADAVISIIRDGLKAQVKNLPELAAVS